MPASSLSQAVQDRSFGQGGTATLSVSSGVQGSPDPPHLPSSAAPAYLGGPVFCAFPNPPGWAVEDMGSLLCFICRAFCLDCPLPTHPSLFGRLTPAG